MKKLLRKVCAEKKQSYFTVEDIAEMLKMVDELRGIKITVATDQEGFDALRIGDSFYSLKSE